MNQVTNVYADGAAYVDGEVTPVAEAKIPLLDTGFLRSDTTYDVVHVVDGRFFRLDDHLDRFLAGAGKLRFDLPLGKPEIARMMHRLVALTGLTEAYVNVTASRGPLAKGSRSPLACRNRIYAFAVPMVWIAPPTEHEQGISMIVASPERIPMASFDQTIKNYMWGDLTAGMIEADDRGAKVSMLLDRDGNVTEGPGFNVFAVAGGRLMTPDTGVLHGITRRTAIELAQGLNIEVCIAPLALDTLKDADEIFITSTAGGIIPVTRLDDSAVSDGVPGPVSMRLREKYWQAHADPKYAVPVDYDCIREPA
ncbi:MAG TPA: aminotransferase class IV [Aestuariivirgaceae bacterium]|nr:aminotransferase class IV [Aestuariivirgaceae bacterium]